MKFDFLISLEKLTTTLKGPRYVQAQQTITFRLEYKFVVTLVVKTCISLILINNMHTLLVSMFDKSTGVSLRARLD